jgi:hypothetical protein
MLRLLDGSQEGSEEIRQDGQDLAGSGLRTRQHLRFEHPKPFTVMHQVERPGARSERGQCIEGRSHR